MTPLRRHEALMSFLFLAPYLIVFVIFLLAPVVWTFLLSLREGGLLSGTSFIGLRNYVTVWSDSLFLTSLRNTIYYTLLVVPVALVLSLATALCLHEIRSPFIQNFIKLAIFFPLVSSVVSLAIIWKALLLPGRSGAINYLLSLVGVIPQNWLFDPKLVIPTLVIFEIWRGYGFWVLVLFAGLQSLPQEVLEAARIDGATGWRTLIHVTLPLLRPSITFLVIMGTIWNFQLFDAVYMLTSGGPANASATVVWYIYRNAFHFEKLGYASTMSIMLLLVILGLSFFQLRYLGADSQD